MDGEPIEAISGPGGDGSSSRGEHGLAALPPLPGWLGEDSLAVIEEGACGYLPHFNSRAQAFRASYLPSALYHQLMNANFRRSGDVFYRPACLACRRCVAIRVPAAGFRASKSQRRCWRRNHDLVVEVGPPSISEEKWDIYRRYLIARHPAGSMRERLELGDEAREDLERMHLGSPVETIEFRYLAPPVGDGGPRLVAVGLCDLSESSLSSVYFYFDPDESRRGLGVFGALAEIEFCRARSIPHYYLGFWVEGCRSMEYKREFRPCELLGADGAWRPAPEAG